MNDELRRTLPIGRKPLLVTLSAIGVLVFVTVVVNLYLQVSDLQTDVSYAREAADEAQQDAEEAKEMATDAQSASEDAKSTADDALSKAEDVERQLR